MRKLCSFVSALVAPLLLIYPNSIAAASSFDQCAEHLPNGAPTAAVAVSEVCHTGYAAAVDNAALVLRWVAYRLTGEHGLGCNKRRDNFHDEGQLPGTARAEPAGYAAAEFDSGHQRPSQNFA